MPPSDSREDLDRDENPLSLTRALATLYSPGERDPLDDLLRLVGEGLEVSRAYLFQLRDGGRTMDNTHEWCAPGVAPQIDGLRDLPCRHFPWWMKNLESGEGVVLESLADLPPEAENERRMLAEQEIQAALVLPLFSASRELIGFMGFDDVTAPREWTDREREALALICQVGARELDRMRAARDLHRVRQRLVQTERIARVGGWEFQPANGATWWSDQAYELLDLPRSDGPATLFDFFQRVHIDDRERTRRIFLRILDDEEPFLCECRVLGADGNTRSIEVQGAIREGESGRSLVVGTVQDVSERRTLEEQLRHAQRMDAVGRLAGGVAHDFNNLLSVILGSAGFLLDSSEADDPGRNDVVQIRQAAEKAASLTRQLLAFSRRQMLEPRTLDLAEVVSNLEGLVRQLLPEDVRLVVERSEDEALVHVDPAHVEQVVLNLAVNARDAMAEDGGTLRIATEVRTLGGDVDAGPGQRIHAGDYVAVEVQDNGCGMNPEVQARIFEPFFTTKPHGEGAGLGLSSAFGIVQQSGGAILVDSEPGVGSRFVVLLPKAPATPDGDPVPDAHPREAGSDGGTDARADGTRPSMRGEARTILIVEDDEHVTYMVRRILEKEGFLVHSARDADRALSLGGRVVDDLDLLITDVVMPETDGRRLADRLRALRPDLPVLFMSGHSASVLSRKGVSQPADAVLAKPFTAEELLDRVQGFLAGDPAGR